MKLFYNGKLTPQQVRGWIINRYYYQRQIPVKDSIILSNITEPVSRKMWLQRMMKREGLGAYRGDVEGWAKFAEAAGIASTTLEKMDILPGVRMAVDAYINFVRTVSWFEGAAASLSELFALDELPKRITALRNHYNWIDQRGVEFFLERLSYLKEDVDLVLELVAPHIRGREMLKKCLQAAAFNCDVHWSMLDAIYMGYVVSKKATAP
ncbi:pyrroloquinoline-quinone synthase [Candidatus Caldarchaeum subterraneum]|uniref:Pyrroloquinoline-quinone synthase n=1 Tax=Caldiarchaeum subterraneum TaxID=311458 RepID=E6N4H5_CALS0|nr:pyrroloquinoline-quinone synthase [Candidatus Caldarchaeum subterraneum]BAJ47265.1 pyrroloquinoline-quinone synthase [Candidatus Caldarchaeum subterraneum]BAJ50069.1 pyrroloquinoline-quinone synthase [Candidatus Caldarchaeum subterraneum]